jgi:hypothetical protein
MTLFDKMKKTAQDAANRMEESANAIKDKASAAMEGVTDKQTYISASQAIKTKLTEDKDGNGVPDILDDAGKGAIKIGKTVSGVQAYQDGMAAKQEKAEADKIKSFIETENERRRQESNKILDAFGRVRLEALQDTVGKFIIYLDLINKKAKVKEYEFLTSIDVTKEQVKELETVSMNASTALKTLAVSGGSAAAVVMGVPAIITQFAAASTGTAIASLHGAAATNAVFAWLGGGSIASGGLGVAGGMAVLGTLTGVAALASAGVVATAYFAKKHTEATQYLADMKELKAKMELGWTVLENVNKRALELQNVTLQLKERCIQGLEQLADIMIGFDAQNTEHLKTFQQTAILIKSMSELAQVPVMDEEGNVSEMSGIVKGKVLNVLNNQLH